MTSSEAITLLDLEAEFDKELLRLHYHKAYIRSFRKKSASMTEIEVGELEKQLIDFNEAFCLIDQSELLNTDELQFDFRHKKFEIDKDSQKSRSSIKNVDTHIDNLIQNNRYGLALSLLEIGINRSLEKDSEVSMASLSTSINKLGSLMIEMGLISQGVQYLNFNKDNFNVGKSYKAIGEYKQAIHYFALELKNEDSIYPVDDVCQHISVCHFLLGDYPNSIRIIEEVLPQLLPKKSIFEESCKWKVFASAIMVSMYKLNVINGSKIDSIKLRMQYPLSFKYLLNCYGSISEAWKVIEQFDLDGDLYDSFLSDLSPKPILKKDIDLNYTISELEENYFDLFEIPMKKSLIYNPK